MKLVHTNNDNVGKWIYMDTFVQRNRGGRERGRAKRERDKERDIVREIESRGRGRDEQETRDIKRDMFEAQFEII